jgi:hypothetical protein
MYQLNPPPFLIGPEHHHYLHYLHVVGCHLKLLGNKEFEVSEVTLTVVTRRSTSGGHGVSVLESVTGTYCVVVGRTHFKQFH